MRNFKKVFMCALVTGMALSASADVFAQRGPGDRFGWNDGSETSRPGRDRADGDRSDRQDRRRFGHGDRNRGPEYSVESEFIGKVFYPGERLFLGRELGLRSHSGKEVERVELEIEGMRRGGSMSLFINGEQVSRTQQFRGGRVGDQVISFNLRRPFVIGQNLQRIQIQIDGTAYVREALVVLKKEGRRPGPRLLQNRLYKDVIGQEELSVSDLVDANFRQEQSETRFVEIEFHSYAQANQIRLCETRERTHRNDFNISFDVRPIGRVFIGNDRGRGRGRDHSMRCESTQLVQGRGAQKLRIFTNGKKLSELNLMIRGDLTLEQIKVGLAR